MTSVFLRRVLTALRETGERPAFVRPDGTTLSYAGAFGALRALHGTLAAEGIGAGDTVAVFGGHHPGTILAQLAAHLRGASVLLVPHSAAPRDREALLDRAGVTAVLVDAEHARDDGHPGCGPFRVVVLPTTRHETLPGPGGGDPGDPTGPCLPSSVHTVFGSGGTTGAPKLISHRGIYEGMAHIFRPDPDGPNRVLLVAPLSHLTGHCAVLGALLGGDTVVLHGNPRAGFDPGSALSAIERHRITHLSLTPPRLAALLDHPALAATDTSSVRSLSLGASPLPRARLRQALDAFGPVVGQGYGLTEAPMIADIGPGEYEGHPERLASVGRVVPGMEARIADGEVLVRGLALMEGYHRDAEATARAVTGGWLRTGDLGRFDDDGYLYLLGRADDVIVTGEHGTKVHPSLVEDALVAHPLVSQAAVVGVDGGSDDSGSDDSGSGDGGARPHAVVVAAAGVTADDLRAHVRTTLVGEHFVPARVSFTDALPLTPVGKVDRTAVRARLASGAHDRDRAPH